MGRSVLLTVAFSDLNIDCFYLLNRFGEIPYHADQVIDSSQKGTGRYIQAAYRDFLRKSHGKYDYKVENVARQIGMVMRSERSWFSKISLIATILSVNKVKVEIPRNISGPSMNIPIREDLSRNSVERISEVLGGITDRGEARKFYDYWIKPRSKDSELTEVNTLKWESEIKGKGSNLTVSNVPSSLVVLDTSKSMENEFDNAAISAFINLLSVEGIGSKTASVTFSTEYYSADWQSSTLEKEIALSLYLGNMTIIPLNEILRLVAESENRVLINIITDCGWQNIEEAIPILERIVKNGHSIKIFYIRGGDYPNNIKRVSEVRGIRVIPVRDPERDLRYLITKETSEDYGRLMLVFKG